MFKIFIITLWLEYDGKLMIKYALPLQEKCNFITWWNIQEQFAQTPYHAVAMKCTKIKDFRIDKRIYSHETYE